MHLDLMLLNFCRSNVSDEISLSARAGASNVSGEGRYMYNSIFREDFSQNQKCNCRDTENEASVA